MSLDVHTQELQRERWRRQRDRLSLLDPQGADFGTRGLAVKIASPTLRFLILPGNPENELVEFDATFWQWWLDPWPDPATGEPIIWRNHRPAATAAVLGNGPEEQWESYLALHRSGALELVMARGVTYELPDARAFSLLNMVGRLWATLGRYREVVERFTPEGPWEVSLALRETEGTTLGCVAEGWREPSGRLSGPVCAEVALLRTRELWEASWSDATGVQQLAFNFGAWIEDAWGCQFRRFLVRIGDRAGQFDAMRYRLSM